MARRSTIASPLGRAQGGMAEGKSPAPALTPYAALRVRAVSLSCYVMFPYIRSPTPRRWIRRLATPPLVALAIVLVLAEEYLWRGLRRLGEAVGRLSMVHAVETRIAALPPTAALAMLLAPTTLVVPVKLAAVWLIAMGHVLSGCAIILAAKVLGTALLARLYTLCEPVLRGLPWFERWRARVLDARNWAHRKLEATAAWRAVRAIQAKRKAVSSGRGNILSGRWHSIRRRMAARRG